MDEDFTLKVLLEFLDAAETGIHAARQSIKQRKLGDSKQFWEEKQGSKGEYQQTSKRANDNSIAFQELQKRLKEHNGFMVKEGFSYWFHQDDTDVIDRRKIQVEK